ncbi:MAG: ribosome biogenesis factor YjgA [Cardiobacteriaceae bacterium]|nr:ribosome biogenesis factor YjgA [Cardiobacteriaceae bacterium]
MTEKQYDEEGRVIRENRSQAKREREHVKTFARELLKLPAHQYPLLPINETLIAALIEGKRLSGNALSRHLNYLTRLIDEQDFTAIRHAHEHVNHPYLRTHDNQKRIKREIERLLDGDPDIFNELLSRYSELDLQHLRQLTREAQKQRNTHQEKNEEPNPAPPNKYQRHLQKYLQSLPLYYESEDYGEDNDEGISPHDK